MILVVVTFGSAVMSFYSLYKYRYQQNEPYKLYLSGMLQSFILYLISTITFIYMANKVTKEVSMSTSHTRLRDNSNFVDSIS